MTDYWNFVHCTRESLVSNKERQTYSKGQFSFRLLPKWTAWVEDFYIDKAPASKVPGPVFHHGVKIDTAGQLNIRTSKASKRYSLLLNEKSS